MNSATSRLLVSVSLAMCLFFPRAIEAKIIPKDLRVEWLPSPEGVDANAPRLSWLIESDERGQKQNQRSSQP